MYLAIILYISNCVASLAIMIVGKNISKRIIHFLVSVHVLLLLFFFSEKVLSLFSSSNNFLLFFCSGVLLCGYFLRMGKGWILKIYFFIYALSFPLFLVKPSLLIHFLMTANFNYKPIEEFHLTENYFLQQQTGSQVYKLVSKHGIFTKTIERDIDFGAALDSVLVLKSDSASIHTRGYFKSVNSQADSLDIMLKKLPERKNAIERKRN